MKKLLFICLLVQAYMGSATAGCLNACQLDPVVGVWLFNVHGVVIDPDRNSPELMTFHPEGIIDYVFLDIPLPEGTGFPSVFEGSGQHGYWRKLSEGVYQTISAERFGFKELQEEFGDCCGNVDFGMFRDTIIFTIDPNNPNLATIRGKLEIFASEDLCLSTSLFCAEFEGDACRLNFVNCPTAPGVFSGCQSCIGLAIRQKYCSECVDNVFCPVVPQ